MLQAQGYSYAEICELCGWTYTKVNRCWPRAGRGCARRRSPRLRRCLPYGHLPFREGVGEDRVADLVARLERLPELIGTIREYRFGPDLGLTEGAGDFAIVAVFDDADGWRAYRDHPSHLEVVELIGEMIEARTPVQFELRKARG